VKHIADETVMAAIDTASAAFAGHWSKLLQSLLTIADGQQWTVDNMIAILMSNLDCFDKLGLGAFGRRPGSQQRTSVSAPRRLCDYNRGGAV
jgi:hypothetical protein